MEWNKIWALSHGDNYIRFYPNPGINFKWRGKLVKWSKHYGWKLSGTVRKA